MKKFFFLIAMASVLVPAKMMATDYVDTVVTVKEFSNAMTSSTANNLKAGDTYTIVCKWDAADVQSGQNIKPSATAGKFIIKSDETDYDKMPQVPFGFDWQTDIDDDGKFSLVFENLGLQFRSGKDASSGQIIYFNGHNLQCDSVIVHNCDISNYPRSFWRSVAKVDTDSNRIVKHIGKFEVTNCRIHDANVTSGNCWPIFYLSQAIDEFTLKNNIFYNIPYCKAIYLMNYVTDDNVGSSPILTFENNTVMMARWTENIIFSIFNPSGLLAAGATYYINNNMFIAPQAGEYNYIMQNDTCDFTPTTPIITNVGDGLALVYAHNNIIDTIGYELIDPEDESMFIYGETENNFNLEDAGITSWEEGVVFQDPANSLYYMLKSSKPYTMGVNGTYLGSANTYIDDFPTKCKVDITIDGPSYITYTITPEKTTYYKGDEITITINDHNNTYRTFNTFNGWTDGSQDLVRNITLNEDFIQTASFTDDVTIISAFDFSTITANNNKLEGYDADIYFDMNSTYQASVKAIVCDTANYSAAPFGYTEGYFQARPSKFTEDPEEMQMPIISRRTSAIAKSSQRDYALFTINTKEFSNISFSAFVGTDNNASKTQLLEASKDSIEWESIAEVDIENGVWSELSGTLTGYDDLEKVYVRIIGKTPESIEDVVYSKDPSSGIVDDNGNLLEEEYNNSDAFEYIGNIIIKGTVSEGIISINNNDENGTNSYNAPLYNLMGMRVVKGTKGLLIQNGKKVLVK